jgi:hypothetical protein
MTVAECLGAASAAPAEIATAAAPAASRTVFMEVFLVTNAVEAAPPQPSRAA